MPSLSSVYLFLAVVGGAIALLQALASLVGFGATVHIPEVHALDTLHHGAEHPDSASALGVFNFRSVRAIATGLGFAGLGGLLAERQFSEPIALAAAAALGLLLYLVVAFVVRGFTRLEADHSLRAFSAIGQQAMVSLPIPARGAGPGKVTLVVSGRRVEWPAVQAESAPSDESIAAGTEVQVIDAADDTTLTVVPLPSRT